MQQPQPRTIRWIAESFHIFFMRPLLRPFFMEFQKCELKALFLPSFQRDLDLISKQDERY